MCHVLHVTCHVSPVIVIFYFLFIKKKIIITTFLMKKFTKWWSQSVEGLLSKGPTPSSFIHKWIHCWRCYWKPFLTVEDNREFGRKEIKDNTHVHKPESCVTRFQRYVLYTLSVASYIIIFRCNRLTLSI